MSIKLPTASTTKDGILTNASQTVAGDKTFNMSAQTTFTSTGTARLRLNSGGVSNQAIVEINAVDTGDFPSLQFFQAGTMQGIVRGSSTAPFQALNASSTIIAAASTAGAWTFGTGTTETHTFNGRIKITQGGSVGAPGIYMGTDTDTGIYSDSDGIWRFSSNGTQIATFQGGAGGYFGFVKRPRLANNANVASVSSLDTNELTAAVISSGYVVITSGVGAGFNLDRIATGSDGDLLYMVNSSGQPMTVVHQSVSGVGSQVFNKTGASITVPNNTAISFIYSGANAAWATL